MIFRGIFCPITVALSLTLSFSPVCWAKDDTAVVDPGFESEHINVGGALTKAITFTDKFVDTLDNVSQSSMAIVYENREAIKHQIKTKIDIDDDKEAKRLLENGISIVAKIETFWEDIDEPKITANIYDLKSQSYKKILTWDKRFERGNSTILKKRAENLAHWIGSLLPHTKYERRMRVCINMIGSPPDGFLTKNKDRILESFFSEFGDFWEKIEPEKEGLTVLIPNKEEVEKCSRKSFDRDKVEYLTSINLHELRGSRVQLTITVTKRGRYFVGFGKPAEKVVFPKVRIADGKWKSDAGLKNLIRWIAKCFHAGFQENVVRVGVGNFAEVARSIAEYGGVCSVSSA